MNLKIKEEYLDCNIVHPHSGKELNVRFQMEPSQYEYYYNNGYQHIFDVEAVKEEKPTNDFPKSNKR